MNLSFEALSNDLPIFAFFFAALISLRNSAPAATPNVTVAARKQPE
jgi:hypothetical protein